MSTPDSLSIGQLSYDSATETVSFQIKGHQNGKGLSIIGNMNVKSPGDLKESEVREVCKASLKQLLLATAALL